MINHPEPIDIAMVKAIEDGSQTQIYKFVEVPERDLMLECLTRTHRVRIALMNHEKYREVKK